MACPFDRNLSWYFILHEGQPFMRIAMLENTYNLLPTPF